MSTPKTPAPPAHLGKDGARFWRETVQEWGIEDHLLPTLASAAACLDRIATARNRIKRDGLLMTGSRGALVAHPAVQVERQQATTHAALVKSLDLKDNPAQGPRPRYSETGRPAGRPPATTPRRGSKSLKPRKSGDRDGA